MVEEPDILEGLYEFTGGWGVGVFDRCRIVLYEEYVVRVVMILEIFSIRRLECKLLGNKKIY